MLDQLLTPCYIINEDQYRNNIEVLMNEFDQRWNNNTIYGYSIKTNHFPFLANIAKEYGWFAEAVSNEEIQFAKRNNFKNDQIIMNGPLKDTSMIEYLKNRSIVNLDNLDEVNLICAHKDELKFIDFNLGLRVNFDLEKECPGETTCGDEVNRFGISYENGDLEKAFNTLKSNGLKVNGLHLHSSSSSRSCNIYTALCKMIIQIKKEFDLDLLYIDIGGGFFGGNFFSGKPTFAQYAECICNQLKNDFDPARTILILEPGAAILATSSDYLVSVKNIRDIRGTKVVTVDGTCTHINPFMKSNFLVPCSFINIGDKTTIKQIIGGSSCMEMDRFIPRGLENVILINTKFLFHCAGAYTMTHNSSFINTPPRVYVNRNGVYSLIREKKSEIMDF